MGLWHGIKLTKQWLHLVFTCLAVLTDRITVYIKVLKFHIIASMFTLRDLKERYTTREFSVCAGIEGTSNLQDN